ncbi:MAG: hypothetical protein ACOZBL_02875 [Patescibacteria group bacterium]
MSAVSGVQLDTVEIAAYHLSAIIQNTATPIIKNIDHISEFNIVFFITLIGILKKLINIIQKFILFK